MNQTKIPVVGDVVLYFPNGSDEKFSGYFIDRPFPAVVVDGGDLAPCLNILTKNPDMPNVVRLSVQHRSCYLTKFTAPYWEWSEIK